MLLLSDLYEREARPELGEKGRRAVSQHRKATAMRRTVLRKGRDDRVATSIERILERVNIGSTVSGIDEKMENGSVMPHVESSQRNAGGDVCLDPLNLPRPGTEALLRFFERRRRDVEHRHVLVAARRERIHEMRRPAAYVDDARGIVDARKGDQIQRNCRLRLKPAPLLWQASSVHLLPMITHAVHRTLPVGAKASIRSMS